MQVLFSPSSPSPSPSRSSKISHPHRHISFKAGHIPRALTPTSDAGFPSVAMVTASSRPNSRTGIVDLTDSPATSPCSSDAALARTPSISSAESNSSTTRTSRSRSPARSYPPPSFSRLTPRSSPSHPEPSLVPMHLAPSARPESPPRRATFLLSGDGDSDREQEREGEAHDDSDDSDRTSFLSAEEFLVPVSALRDAVCAGGRVLDAKFVEGKDEITGWQSQEPPALSEAGPEERNHSQRDTEQDAAHELRRWHALMEVVHTEAGYVRDLRVLVHVYLSHLPSLPLSSRALEAVQELARNAVDLLELHERFVRALEAASAQVAGGVSPRGSVDKAVRQLATLFADEASAFDLYQRFCSIQPDVMRLLRPAQARAEWAVFERQCATGGQDPDLETPTAEKERQTQDRSDGQTGSSARSMSAPTPTPVSPQGPKSPSPRAMSLMPSAFKAYALSTPSSQTADPPHPANHRRHSYDSLAGVFGAASGTIRHRPSIVRPTSETPARSSTPTQSQNSRLRFHDFLIKPVQRICKYPLMLEGLHSKVRGDCVDTVVTTAVESMRAVAMRVDEARRQRETAVKSGLIVERIEPHHVVTPEFLNTLGGCLLAGSLDVVHHHHTLDPITTPVRVKYLGGFLYLGGYLLLVKIGKGKTYRVKHWFSLADFEIVDILPDTALVPSSFRLSYMDHHFEIAVACQREKDLWLRAINEARSASPPWDSEPVSSLQVLQVESSSTPPAVDGPSLDAMDALPMKRGVSSTSMSELSNPLAMLRLSSTRFRPSASTSTPAVRYIFSPTEESSILLHRSSATNRMFVDRGLSDVLSDLISNLRNQAEARQEKLFPPPQLSDASQTIAIAAKNKLMRRGSVMVARSRGPLMPGIPASAPTNADRDEDSTVRPKTMAAHRRHMSLLPALNVLYTEPESIKVMNEPLAGVELQFPKPGSSVEDVLLSTANATSQSGRNTPRSAPLEETNHARHYHRRARSLVGSVRGLIRFGSTRSTTSQEASEAWRAIRRPEDSSSETCESTDSSAKSSIARRRVSSAPTSPQLSTSNSIFFPDSDQGSSTTSTSPDTPFPPPSTLKDPSSASATSGTKVFRKKSASIPLNHDQTLKPRRSFKNFVFYNRLTAVDPA